MGRAGKARLIAAGRQVKYEGLKDKLGQVAPPSLAVAACLASVSPQAGRARVSLPQPARALLLRLRNEPEPKQARVCPSSRVCAGSEPAGRARVWERGWGRWSSDSWRR